MTTSTKIEWCDHTWNPWQGCTPVSAGCERCYMATAKRRYGADPARVVRSAPGTFNGPLAKHRDGSWKWPAGSSVFACSWSDFFHEAADPWRDDAWRLIRRRQDLRFLLLTKRPERISRRLPDSWPRGWEHVGIGVTAENHEQACRRIPILLEMSAAMRFVSCEPLLNRADLLYAAFTGAESFSAMGGLDWVIAGGESGPNRRPPEDDWFRVIRDDCRRAGVPFFFKTRGQPRLPGNDLLDGERHHERPEWLEAAP